MHCMVSIIKTKTNVFRINVTIAVAFQSKFWSVSHLIFAGNAWIWHLYRQSVDSTQRNQKIWVLSEHPYFYCSTWTSRSILITASCQSTSWPVPHQLLRQHQKMCLASLQSVGAFHESWSKKHRKNCECCPLSCTLNCWQQRLSWIQVLDCKNCNQCRTESSGLGEPECQRSPCPGRPGGPWG